MPAARLGEENEAQPPLLETVCQLDVLRTLEVGVEATGREDMLAAHGSVTGVEMARAGRP